MLCVQLRSPPAMKRLWTLSVLAPLGLIILGAAGCGRVSRFLNGPADEPAPVVIDSQTTEAGQASEAAELDPQTSAEAQELRTVGESQILSNALADIEITLSDNWSRAELHDSAELEAADLERQLYLVVVAEQDETLSTLALEEIAARYRALLKDQMAAYESESPTNIDFIGGDYAEQYEVRGRVDNDTPVVYLHTTVLSAGTYYHVVAWTTPEQYEAYRSELQEITETFRNPES